MKYTQGIFFLSLAYAFFFTLDYSILFPCLKLGSPEAAPEREDSWVSNLLKQEVLPREIPGEPREGQWKAMQRCVLGKAL